MTTLEEKAAARRLKARAVSTALTAGLDHLQAAYDTLLDHIDPADADLRAVAAAEFQAAADRLALDSALISARLAALEE